MVRTGLLLLAAACLVCTGGCRKPSGHGSAGEDDPAAGSVLKDGRENVMGTRISVQVWTPGGQDWERKAREGMEAAFDEALEVQARMSPRDPASAVSRINEVAGEEEVVVDPWTWKVIQESVEASRITRGAFDPTWAALEDLWDFKSPGTAPPAKEDVEARLGLVGVRGLVLDPESRSVRLASAGMRIGLGGSAKGFALDRMAAALRDGGLDDFICYAGGDLYVSGKRGSRPWILGIQHPRSRGAKLARFEVDRPMAVVTSGDYERYFVHRGQRYHHIIDPRTGFPAAGTMSVTLMASSGLRADALSTGLFVLGAAEAMKIVESLTDVEAVIVDGSGGVHCSASMCERLELLVSDFKLVGRSKQE